MTTPIPPNPPRPQFIEGKKRKKIAEKRELGEIWNKAKTVIMAGVMILCILLASWLYTSTTRVKRGDATTKNKQTKDQLEELKELSEKKEAAFEEIKLKKDTLGEEDIGLLAEAVKAQEDYVVKKGVLSSDNSRLEGLRKKLHIINAEILRASSRQAEETAQKLETSNPLEAKNLLRKALEAEQTIQNKWIYSGMADVGKIARIDTRLRRLEAIPLWEKTREYERQAEAFFKEENIELAVDSIKEAIKVENTFLEKYRDVLNTEFKRIDNLGIRKETYLSFPLYKKLLAFEIQAEEKEKEEKWTEAEKLWNEALDQQEKIISQNPLSEYADQKNKTDIEKRRNIARATPEVKILKGKLEEIRTKLREKDLVQASQDAKTLLKTAQKIERENPGVLPEDSPVIQELSYLVAHQGILKLINSAAEGMFIPHPVKKEIKMMRHEVPQSFYEAVVGINPSAVVKGNLPVESVNYDDTQKFCRELGWLTGKKIRLPTPEEFIQAAGENGEKTTSTQNWTFDNTDGLTTRNIATSQPNHFGFFDLIGNVEEWTESPAESAEATILGGSVNTVIKKEFPSRKALKRERSRTLGFRVIQE